MQPAIEHLRACFQYDEVTGSITNKTNRRRARGGQDACSKRPDGYMTVSVGSHKLLAHRVAWALVHGYWPNLIDHINGDRSDNRLCNLRDANKQINAQNVNRPRANNRSGYLGVSFCKQTGTWLAQIRAKDKKINLGRYATAEEASGAYMRSKQQFHARAA